MCLGGGLIVMAQWATSSYAEVVYLILSRSLGVCFEEGFPLKYENIL